MGAKEEVAKAYDVLAETGDFKTFKLTFDSIHERLKSRLAEIEKCLRELCKRFARPAAVVRCNRCGEGIAACCSCKPWVIQAREEQRKLWEEQAALRAELESLAVRDLPTLANRVAILKSVHLSSPDDIELGKFYYKRLEEYEMRCKEEKERQRALRERKRQELAALKRQLDDYAARMKEVAAQLEKCIAENGDLGEEDDDEKEVEMRVHMPENGLDQPSFGLSPLFIGHT